MPEGKEGTEVVARATQWNLKLNFDKCQITQRQVNYVGHLVTDKGLKPDPNKVRAMREMPAPNSKEEIRSFLGCIPVPSQIHP